MKPFPTDYTATPVVVTDDGLDSAGRTALESLHEKGFAMYFGLSAEHALQVRQLAEQKSICTYCLNDRRKRFSTDEATRQWLAKGRAAYILVEHSSGVVAGYAWSGPETSAVLPTGRVTVALRLSEDFQGRGLATPYLQAVVSATKAHFDAEHIWLETWESNSGAVHVYQKVGFVPRDAVPGLRELPNGETTPDTRVYMALETPEA